MPFEIVCEDGDIIFAKSMFKSEPPFNDLINEVLSNYLLKCWNIRTAIPCIVKIPQYVYNSFKATGEWVDPRYDTFEFNSKLFFGVVWMDGTELELYHSKVENKHEYNKYSKPIDLVKIGTYDRWIGNNDRRGQNPNILVCPKGDRFDFAAIDHVQSFGNQTEYRKLNIAVMNSPQSQSILRTPFSKSIITFAGSDFFDNFDTEVLINIQNSIENIDFVLDQVHKSFGLSKGGKKRIKEILSNAERNETISKCHINQ